MNNTCNVMHAIDQVATDDLQRIFEEEKLMVLEESSERYGLQIRESKKNSFKKIRLEMVSDWDCAVYTCVLNSSPP